jgi:hypothetical protein
VSDVMLPWPGPRRRADDGPRRAPHYEIQQVFDDGSGGPLEVVPITRPPWSAKAGRRGFLGAGVASSVVLGLLLTGCNDGSSSSTSTEPTSSPTGDTGTTGTGNLGGTSSPSTGTTGNTGTGSPTTGTGNTGTGSPTTGTGNTGTGSPTTGTGNTGTSTPSGNTGSGNTGTGGGGTICTCNKVCTCIPVGG